MKAKKPVPRQTPTVPASAIDRLLHSALTRARHPAAKRWLRALLVRGEVEKGGQK